VGGFKQTFPSDTRPTEKVNKSGESSFSKAEKKREAAHVCWSEKNVEGKNGGAHLGLTSGWTKQGKA